MATLWVGKEPKGKFHLREYELIDGTLRISKGGKLLVTYPLARSHITTPKYLSVPDRPHCFLLEAEVPKEKRAKEGERIPLYLDAGDEKLSGKLRSDIRVADPLRVFYVPLELAASRSDYKKSIPRPWRWCLRWLNTHALEEPNLYCVPGSRTDVEAYIHRFDADEKDLTIPPSEYPHTVASVLVHCLSEDLWNGHHERFVELARDFDADDTGGALTPKQVQSLEEMRRLISSHPRVLRASLRLLFEHFCLVVAHSAKNQMNATKLGAAIFPRTGLCVSLMITHFDRVFGPPTEIFGESLGTALERANADGIPTPVRDTVTWLDNNALHEVGLYRIPGDDRKVTSYMNMYDDGQQVVFPPSELSETVASVLKSFIYSMDETLLQSDLKTQFLAVHGDKGYGALIEQFSQMASGRPAAAVAEVKDEVVLSEEEKFAATKALMAQMIPRQKILLKFLMGHWGRVANNSQENKMTARNLALSLYPGWAKTFQFLVENQEALFA